MEHFDRRQHWEKIYQTKQTEEASWYQPLPETSLDFFEMHGISATSKIIDLGGGESLHVDHHLDRGHRDITVLDILKNRLPKRWPLHAFRHPAKFHSSKRTERNGRATASSTPPTAGHIAAQYGWKIPTH